jgi:hypothetical protein
MYVLSRAGDGESFNAAPRLQRDAVVRRIKVAAVNRDMPARIDIDPIRATPDHDVLERDVI